MTNPHRDHVDRLIDSLLASPPAATTWDVKPSPPDPILESLLTERSQPTGGSR